MSVEQIELNGVLFRYRRLGEGSDLILTHGLGDSLTYWDQHLDTLAKRHRVLCWDMRGFGESGKPAGPYTIDLFAADLAALVSALGIRRAHFTGISMGGVITQRLVQDRPDLFRSMTLISTSSQVGKNATKGWTRLADLIERRGFGSSPTAAARSFSPDFARRHPEAVAAASRITAANDPAAYAAAARAVADYNWTEQLRQVRVPTLLLQGTDDQLTPPGGSVLMSRALRRCCLLIIAGAGHNLPIEQPAVFESALLAFTAGIDFCPSDRSEEQ